MRGDKGSRYWSQFVKFALTGLISTAVNLVLLYMLTEYAGLLYVVSAFFAYLAGTLASFYVNKTWTFDSKTYGHRAAYSVYVEYLVFSLLSMCVGLVMLCVLVEFVGFWYMHAQLFSLFLGMVVNFNLQRFYTFRSSGKRRES